MKPPPPDIGPSQAKREPFDFFPIMPFLVFRGNPSLGGFEISQALLFHVLAELLFIHLPGTSRKGFLRSFPGRVRNGLMPAPYLRLETLKAG